MLDIARGGDALQNSSILKCIRLIGSPIIKDSKDEFWIIPPISYTIENYWLEMFPAIEEIFKCLTEGCTICELLPWCIKSPQTQEDDRCINSPWDRVKDQNMCPYALLWKHWALEGYTPCQ